MELFVFTVQHPTWHLVASKWHFNWADVVVVDKAGSCLQVLSHTVGSGNVSAGQHKGQRLSTEQSLCKQAKQ